MSDRTDMITISDVLRYDCFFFAIPLWPNRTISQTELAIFLLLCPHTHTHTDMDMDMDMDMCVCVL